MKMSDHEVNSHLRERFHNVAGRHLYVILGTYDALARYERIAFPEVRDPDNEQLRPALNVNYTLLERLPDEELKELVQNEARRPQQVKDRLYHELDRLLAEELAKNSIVTLKQVELLFAYDLELDKLRTRATNQKHILLLLPGQRSGDNIWLFHEAAPQWHRTMPNALVPEEHLCEILP
jgi:hypothetical protein